jgi:hypothetical protein
VLEALLEPFFHTAVSVRDYLIGTPELPFEIGGNPKSRTVTSPENMANSLERTHFISSNRYEGAL